VVVVAVVIGVGADNIAAAAAMVIVVVVVLLLKEEDDDDNNINSYINIHHVINYINLYVIIM